MSALSEVLQSQLLLAARLLSYPDTEWRADLPDLEHEASELAQREARLRAAAASSPKSADGQDDSAAFSRFACFARQVDAKAFEVDYVNLFDLSRDTTLYLASYQAGDPAQHRKNLLAYSTWYVEEGFEATDESYDYLPAVLELASQMPPRKAADILAHAQGSLEALADALGKVGQPEYAALVRQVIALGRRLADSSKEEVA